MSDTISVGVIGASGMMGKSRVRHFQEDPRSQVLSACARDIRRLAEAVPDESISLVAHADEVLDDPRIQAVTINVPNTLHYDHVLHPRKKWFVKERHEPTALQ